MEFYTNRAAKHRYGQQTSSNEHVNLQIRSMSHTKPTSAELTSPRKHNDKRHNHQWITQENTTQGCLLTCDVLGTTGVAASPPTRPGTSINSSNGFGPTGVSENTTQACLLACNVLYLMGVAALSPTRPVTSKNLNLSTGVLVKYVESSLSKLDLWVS